MTDGTGPTMHEVSHARFGALVAHGVDAVTHDARDLTSGFWAVVLTFEGELTAARMTDVRRAGPEPAVADWPGLAGPWSTSLDRDGYVAGVEEIRRRVAEGTVYQVNLCRVLEHELPENVRLGSLGPLLRRGNPAPYAATVDLPEAGLEVACASPEAFLVRRGDRVTSRPIKGTGTEVAALLQKDYAENVMIVDLVRNDLAHVCRAGTVEVENLCRVEQHPGLVHLVSDVAGLLTRDAGWPDILAATFPPGSVSGAPKHTALQAIAELEPMPRGPYCGAVGWVDADDDRAELAVGIRTFWSARRSDGARVLRFGTGAGITWASDPAGEWAETELKAARLVGLAAGSTRSSGRLWS